MGFLKEPATADITKFVEQAGIVSLSGVGLVHLRVTVFLEQKNGLREVKFCEFSTRIYEGVFELHDVRPTQ